MEQSFIAYIENSIKNNWDLDALTDYKGATLQYKDVARKIEKLHIIFEESGIRKGDKIAVAQRLEGLPSGITSKDVESAKQIGNLYMELGEWEKAKDYFYET